MGVRGLTTFVEDNQRRLYGQEKVHDCHLVIDGYGLLYHLYFERGGNLNSKCGGEFAALDDLIERFFSNLKECGIKPCVVFDGPINSEKLPCILSRLQDRVRDVHNILESKADLGKRVMPLFAVDILYHHLSTHGIPYAMSLVDADNEIVAVANYLNCPVLSEDSDYYIYNVKNGYIPLQHFDWEKIWVDKSLKRKSIVCLKYHISLMRDAYRVPVQLLPFVSVLLGNDWIDRDTFYHLIGRLPLLKSREHLKRKKVKKLHGKFETIFSWLASKSGNESSILSMLESSVSPPNAKEAIMSKVEACLGMYRDPLDVSRTLQALGLSEPVHMEIFEDPRAAVEDLVRRNCIHPIAVNILYSDCICLPVIMSDPTKPSPHSHATDIRTLLYRILLRKYRFKAAGPEFLFLQEYDKVGMTYKKSRSVSVFTALCPMCEQRHLLEDACISTSKPNKHGFSTLDLILKANSDSLFPNLAKYFNFSILENQEFVKHLEIVMASLLLWMKRTSPKADIICALILSVAWSLNQKISRSEIQTQRFTTSKPENDPPFARPHTKGGNIPATPKDSTACDITEKEFLELLSPSTFETASGESETIEFSDFNLGLMHSASEWLCILNAAILLHQVVELPSTKFAMQDFLTSSIFLHNVHSRIKRLSKSKDCENDHTAFGHAVADRLSSLPKIKTMFEGFLEYLLQEK